MNLLQMHEAARELDRSWQHGLALEAYRRYLDADPGSAEGWADYGGLLMVLGRLEEAGEACAKALQIDRTCLSARVNSGCTLLRQGRLDEAKGLFREILAQAPARNDARGALGECLILQHAYDEARVVLGEMLQQDPDSLRAHQLLGQIFHRLGLWSEFREEIDRRRRAQPSCAYVAYELGYLSLLFGDLPAGWKGFEARWRVPRLVGPKRDFPQPRWQGEPFAGKTLLLFHEQGFGDTMMFVRFAPMVKALGGRVLLEAQAPLADLVATCPGIDAVIPHGAPIPPFDLQLPLLSLPAVLQTGLDAIPAGIPYLHIPERVPNRAVIAQVLAAADRFNRVGLAWSGNSAYKNDEARSIPVDALRPLAALVNVFFFGFQVEPAEAPALPAFASLKPCLSNFSDTACALSGMDLVITVDTALAHLAGALGVPTLLLLPFSPDWRWMLGRDDSPWYPSMRLYRQSAPGDWDGVIRRMVADLADPA
jgi:Tfp pilus assembly protein PilF